MPLLYAFKIQSITAYWVLLEYTKVFRLRTISSEYYGHYNKWRGNNYEEKNQTFTRIKSYVYEKKSKLVKLWELFFK